MRRKTKEVASKMLAVTLAAAMPAVSQIPMAVPVMAETVSNNEAANDDTTSTEAAPTTAIPIEEETTIVNAGSNGDDFSASIQENDGTANDGTANDGTAAEEAEIKDADVKLYNRNQESISDVIDGAMAVIKVKTSTVVNAVYLEGGRFGTVQFTDVTPNNAENYNVFSATIEDLKAEDSGVELTITAVDSETDGTDTTTVTLNSETDTTGPTIDGSATGVDTIEWSQSKTVHVEATDAVGFGEKQFNFSDNENEWTGTPSYAGMKTASYDKLYTENAGDVTIIAKDAKDNLSDGYTVTVDKIDHVAPVINSIEAALDEDKNVILTVDAEDAEDGASGVKEYGISTDGEEPSTWQADNKFDVTDKAEESTVSYTVFVRDQALNTSHTVKEVAVNPAQYQNVSKETLAASITETPLSWTQKNVEVSTSIADTHSDAVKDGDVEWSNGSKETAITMEKNGEYSLTVTPSAGPSKGRSVTVKGSVGQIDREAPTVSLSHSGNEMYIDVHDSKSGIDHITIQGGEYAAETTIATYDSAAQALNLLTDYQGNTALAQNGVLGISANGELNDCSLTMSLYAEGEYTVKAYDKLGNALGLFFDDEYNVVDSDNGEGLIPIKDEAGAAEDIHDDVDTIESIDAVAQHLALGDWLDYSEEGYSTKSKTVVVNVPDQYKGLIAKNGFAYSVNDAVSGNNISAASVDSVDGAIDENGDIKFSPYTSSTSHVYSSNGTYYIKVKGVTGKEAISDPIIIDMIDAEAPSLTATQEGMVITVSAKDSGSGIAKITESGPDSAKEQTIFEAAAGSNISSQDVEHILYQDGVYTFYAYDNAGNKSKVTSVDAESVPVLTEKVISDSISSSVPTTTWTKEGVKLSVDLDDQYIRQLADEPYCWSLANGYTLDNTFEVKKNGTYTLRVKDAQGTIYSGKYTVSNIDTDKPTVAAEKDSVKSTITIKAEDAASGISKITYKSVGDSSSGSSSGASETLIKAFDGEKSATATFNPKSNGTFTFYAYDKAGNVIESSSMVVKDLYFLTTAELDDAISISPNEDEWTNSQVEISVKIPSKYKATLPDGKIYSWDGGKRWTKSKTKTVTENDEYTLTVKMLDGSIVESSDIVIKNIDKKAPVLTVNRSGDKMTINATDTVDSASGSGIATIGWMADNGISNTVLKSFTSGQAGQYVAKVPGNGNYTIYAVDKMGNTSTTTVQVTDLKDVSVDPVTGKVTVLDGSSTQAQGSGKTGSGKAGSVSKNNKGNTKAGDATSNAFGGVAVASLAGIAGAVAMFFRKRRLFNKES